MLFIMNPSSLLFATTDASCPAGQYNDDIIRHCDFDSGFCEFLDVSASSANAWELVNGSSFVYMDESIAGPSGPTADHTTATGVGSYAVVRQRTIYQSEPCSLSGDFDLQVSTVGAVITEVTFWYHLYDTATLWKDDSSIVAGRLSLSTSSDGVSWSRSFEAHGNKGGMWHLAHVTIPEDESAAHLRFTSTLVGQDGCFQNIAIDDVTARGSASCSACPAGRYANSGVCEMCPFGKSSSSGSSECSVCSSGHESNVVTTVTVYDFESSFGNFYDDSSPEHGNFATYAWTRLSGSTPTLLTGPTGDHTTGVGTYAYVESSEPNIPNKYFPLARYFEGERVMEVIFWYSMNGGHMGTLSVQVSRDGQLWDTTWSKSNNQGAAWHAATVSIGLSAAAEYIRFVGSTSYYDKGDIAIDDITITTAAIANSCAACSPGTYLDELSGGCAACPPGSFSSESGSILCVLCDAGYHSVSPGTTSCVECGVNQYSVSGADACLSCSFGKSASPGSSFCDDPYPSSRPTALPTISSRVLVFVRIGLQSRFELMPTNKASLEALFRERVQYTSVSDSLISQQGNSMENFALSSTRNRRRLTSSSGNEELDEEDDQGGKVRRRLSQWTWTASFNVVTDMLILSTSSLPEFGSALHEDLSSTSFKDAVMSTATSVFYVASPHVEVITKSHRPTYQPTLALRRTTSDDEDSGGILTGNAAIVLLSVAGLIFAVVIGVGFRFDSGSNKEQDRSAQEDLDDDGIEMLRPSSTSATSSPSSSQERRTSEDADEEETVESFLASLGLGNYTTVLKELGCYDMATLGDEEMFTDEAFVSSLIGMKEIELKKLRFRMDIEKKRQRRFVPVRGGSLSQAASYRTVQPLVFLSPASSAFCSMGVNEEIGNVLRIVGLRVARRPWTTIAASVAFSLVCVVSALTSPVFNFETRGEHLWCPKESLAFQAFLYHEEVFPASKYNLALVQPPELSAAPGTTYDGVKLEERSVLTKLAFDGIWKFDSAVRAMRLADGRTLHANRGRVPHRRSEATTAGDAPICSC